MPRKTIAKWHIQSTITLLLLQVYQGLLLPTSPDAETGACMTQGKTPPQQKTGGSPAEPPKWASLQFRPCLLDSDSQPLVVSRLRARWPGLPKRSASSSAAPARAKQSGKTQNMPAQYVCAWCSGLAKSSQAKGVNAQLPGRRHENEQPDSNIWTKRGCFLLKVCSFGVGEGAKGTTKEFLTSLARKHI